MTKNCKVSSFYINSYLKLFFSLNKIQDIVKRPSFNYLFIIVTKKKLNTEIAQINLKLLTLHKYSKNIIYSLLNKKLTKSFRSEINIFLQIIVNIIQL